MSPHFPVLNARQVIILLEQRGFIQVRQSGSHAIFRHPDGRRTTVPIHSGKDLGRGLLRQIFRAAAIPIEDLS